MRRVTASRVSRLLVPCAVLAALSPPHALAQRVCPTVEFAFTGVPERVVALPGSTLELEVFATVEILDDPSGSGIQGWSMSMGVLGATVMAVNFDGLRIPPEVGPLVGESLFTIAYSAADPDDPSRRGAVAVVVGVGYPGRHEVHPFDPTPVLRLLLEVAVPEGESCQDVVLFYEDGFQGPGAPVGNVVTWEGSSCTPQTCELELCVTSEDAPFARGDANADSRRDISDPIFILSWLFTGGVETLCEEALDTDDDGVLVLTDAIALFDYLFRGGPPPVAPFPDCGEDPADDDLHCLAFAPCG